ncbi:MAG: GxxExxY protein [Synechococcales bacterium]|nr:GxxExxY protein [Synechococcales bacterium]
MVNNNLRPSASSADRDPQTFAIIGAAMTVHATLGNGFLETVYQEALEHEFRLRKVPYEREKQLPVYYQGVRLQTLYRVDFFCFDSIIVELKALARIGGTEEAQVINYLRAAGVNRGLLLNFGTRSLQYNRLVWKFSSS